MLVYIAIVLTLGVLVLLRILYLVAFNQAAGTKALMGAIDRLRGIK